MQRAAALLLLPFASSRPLREVETYESWLAEFSDVHAANPHIRGSKEMFEANIKKVQLHNSDSSKSWKMGVNQFSALSAAEFKKWNKGYSKSMRSAVASTRKPADVSTHKAVGALPTTLDWRTKGVVTPVKDQGGCGGCWAFSAAETLESAVAISTGKLMTLSEQQILDCTPNPNQCGGTGGCNGATQELAFGYVNSTTGITTEADYPFTGGSSFPTCNTNKIKPVAGITGFVALPFNNYTALMNAVQDMPIAISAAAEAWQLYDSGIFADKNCGTDVDHAIVLEGYGVDTAKSLDYYLVRNSWSDSWGENGYIRVARYGDSPSGEPCGIDNSPGDGDGCQGGPSSIKVCGLCGILSDSSYPTGAHLTN